MVSLRLCAALSIVLIGSAIAVAQSTPQPSGSPRQRFQFSGNASFSDDQLYRALSSDPDVLLATHPLGTSAELASLLKKKLVAGYRKQGFPSPQIQIETTADPVGASIAIDEGPQIRNGEVVLRGESGVDAQRLIRRLTEPFPGSDAYPAFSEIEGRTVTRWVDAEGKPAKLEDPVWEIGKPVALDQELALQKKVLAALADLGFSDTPAFVSLEIDDAAEICRLVLHLPAAGSPDQVDEIEIRGAKANSRESILQQLDLQLGTSIDRTKLANMTRKLWACGRFQTHQLSYQRDAAGKGQLTIELLEVPDVPPLDQPLNNIAAVYQRARDWLGSIDQQGTDLVLTLQHEQQSIRIIQAEHGLLLQSFRLASSDGTSPEPRLAILLDGQRLMLAHSDLPTVWTNEIDQVAGQLLFQTKIAAALSAEKLFRLNFNFRWRSSREPDQPPVDHHLDVSPADWVPFAYKRQLSHEWFGNRLVANSESFQLQLDAATGEILSWKSEGLDVRFETGLFERERQRLLAANAGKADTFRSEAAVSSLAAYLCQPTIWQDTTALLTANPQKPNAQETPAQETPAPAAPPFDPALCSGLEKLIAGGLLRPLDVAANRFWQGRAGERFYVPGPSAPPQGLQAMMLAIAARAVLELAPTALEENQWPMQITREACLVLLDRGKYAGKVVQQLQQDPNCGPLCHATIAALLAKINHPAATASAQHGLQQLTPQNFASDLEILLQGECGVWLSEAVAAIGSLAPTERDALATRISPPLLREFFLQAHAISNQTVEPNLATEKTIYRISHESLEQWLHGQSPR